VWRVRWCGWKPLCGAWKARGLITASTMRRARAKIEDLAVKSAGDAVLETDQTSNGLPGLGGCPLLGRNNCFFVFFFNETGSRDDVGPTCSLEESRTSQCASVGFLSVVRLVPCVCDRKPPKRGLNLLCLVPTGFCGSVGSNALLIVLIRRKQPRNAERLCGWPATLPGDGMPGTVQSIPSTVLSSSNA